MTDSRPGPEPDGAAQAPSHARLLPGIEPGPQTVRSFHAILLNTLLANVTSSYLWFGLTFWAYLETRSVLATSIIGGSYMLLVAAASMLFGALVDRHRKKAVMLISSTVTLVTYAAAGLVYLSFPVSRLVDWNGPVFWLFAGVILIGGVVESLRNIALSTCVTLLVPAPERDKANGRVGAVLGIAFMITSVFSGLSIGQLGMGGTLAVAVALTAASLTHLLLIPVPEAVPEFADGDRPTAYDLRATTRTIREVPGLLPLILFATFNNLVGGVFMALMDPYGLTLFSVELWGIVLGVTSLGFVIGGAIVAKFGLGSRPLRALMLVNLVAGFVGVVFTLREWAWLYVVGILAYMCFMPIAEAAEQTILQAVVPFEKQGRVFGFGQMLESGAAPVTAFLIGPIAQYGLIPYLASAEGADRWAWLLGRGEARGIALVFVIAGVLMMIAVVIAMAAPPYRRLSDAYAESVLASSSQ